MTATAIAARTKSDLENMIANVNAGMDRSFRFCRGFYTRTMRGIRRDVSYRTSGVAISAHTGDFGSALEVPQHF